MKWGWQYGWNGSGTQPPATIAPARYSTLGQVLGGETVSADSTLPAWGGKVILVPGATTWIRITGTDAKVGDGVLLMYEGRRTGSVANPAQRILSGAATGAPGTDVLADGVIELSINSANTDLNFVHWMILRQGT